MSSTLARTSSVMVMSWKKEDATVLSASFGHAVNQSMVQQLTSEIEQPRESVPDG